MTNTSSPQTTNWDLSEFYQGIDDPQIELDLASANELIAKLVTEKGTIHTLSPAQLLDFIKRWEAIDLLFDKAQTYAHLLESTNIGVADVTRFTKKIEQQVIASYTQLIFIEVELAQLSEEQWQTYLKAPELQPYHKMLEKQYRAAKHTLSEAEEKILALKSQTAGGALDHLYSVTTDTLEFAWNDQTVTLEELLSKFQDSDPKVRKQAAMTLHQGLATNTKTTPAILNSLVQDKEINDQLRHYEYPEQARFHSDDVEKETVEALVKAVNDSFHLTERYYNLKKKIFKVDEMHWWDRYAPLPEVKAKIDLESAKQMVHEAFTNFSPEVAEIVNQMSVRRHIDWLPGKTKRGGAFCAYGTYKNYPFVLLNYTENPRDVMTVAHELGHAVHDVLAQEDNVFSQVHSSLALAEIASTFGEALLFERLIQSPELSQQDKIGLLMRSIEDQFATAIRQVTMFQFEQELHRKRRAEGELSQEQIDELWDTSMKKPFESSLIYTPEHKNTWMYVGHIFHWPFYVYSYAFAQLCTLALFKQYKEQGSAFVPKYLDILRAGGSLSPKDNLARAGLDINDPNFWKGGLSIIEASIDQLEELVG